jgi:sigma54-dependent transcription regulator
MKNKEGRAKEGRMDKTSTIKDSHVGNMFWGMASCRFLHIYPEDGGSMFLRNAGILISDYTASHLKNLDTKVYYPDVFLAI